MIYKILTGCYIVAALVLVAACNDVTPRKEYG